MAAHRKSNELHVPLQGGINCFSVELCCGEQEQPSSDAITSCISDARLSRLESMFGGALLGESPLLSTSFANPASDESFEAVFDPISTE
jgi:hypothetical protein